MVVMMDIKYPSPIRSGVCMLYTSDSMASAARVLMIFRGVTLFDMQLMMAVLAVWSKNNIKGIANGIANAVSSARATSVVPVDSMIDADRCGIDVANGSSE